MKPSNPHPEITATIIFITPEMAKEMIEANTQNQRNLKKANLAKIENNFRKEVFVLNGESLIRSVSQRILDGQHRLHGCLNTRTGFWTVFVDNVPDEYFATIDSGRARSFSDVLTIRNEKNAHDLAPAALLLGEYMKSSRSVGQGTPLSNNELNDVIEAAPALADSVRFCKRSLYGLASPACVAWLHWVATDGGCGEKFEEFLTSLGSGAMLADDSPIYWLRKRLEANRIAKAKLPRREIIALIVKAWNAYAGGVQVKTLRWSAAENFPEPIVIRLKSVA